jgi:pyruvate/2-oxoglutarate dehydrogenase complex dihydrolipoamide acyltransferase (E2) component
MPIVDVLVPQMGEGLQEVLVVELLKKPGEFVRRDEPFYSMETDKATLDVECPEEGTLVEWLAVEGETLAIGAPVCRIETATAAPSPSPASEADLRSLSPRVRAYAREKGVSETDLVRIPAPSGKLMPEDIDAFLADKPASPVAKEAWIERPISPQDKTFIYRLKRSAEQVIPATAKRQVAWEPVREFADRQKAKNPDAAPSAFNCVAHAIARAVADHPKFRSTLIREEIIREHPHVNLGIGVAVPTGELVVAVVPNADALTFEEFVAVSKKNIALARTGQDQATDATQLVLTYMGHYEIVDAVPVLVAPAAATLFIGSPFDQGGKQIVNFVLTFDHRLVHGVEAAAFLKTVAKNVESLA